MPINTATKRLIDKLTKNIQKPVWEMSPDELRQLIDMGTPMHGEPQPVAKVEELTIDGPNGTVPIRIYIPEGKGPLPALLYFPGSGFIYGSLDLANWLSRELANTCCCKVISVGYRSAPEHKYPKGLNDAFAAMKWVVENSTKLDIDKNKIGVVGYSSGGNYAALTAIRARDENIALKCQLIFAGCLDLSCSCDSHERFAKGYVLEKESIKWYFEQYLPEGANCKDPKISPLWEPNLRDLPEALVIAAEYDPLVDENELYAKKLAKAGVPVKYSCYQGQFHGFLQYRGELGEEKNPLIEISQEVKRIFAN